MIQRWKQALTYAGAAVVVLHLAAAPGEGSWVTDVFGGTPATTTSYDGSSCPTCKSNTLANSAPLAPAPYAAPATTGAYYPSVPGDTMSPTTAFAPMMDAAAYPPTITGVPMAMVAAPAPAVRPEDQPWFPNVRWNLFRPFQGIDRRGDPCCAAAPACSPCDPPCSPCAPACAPAPVTMCQYVPQTRYRTAWRRVPTTVYRPVTTSDPCTGCPVTCMRPCATYTWQAQAVPVRPWFSWLFPPRPATPAACCPTPCYSCPTPCDSGCEIGTCATGSCGQPYYGDALATPMTGAPWQGGALPGYSAPTTPLQPVERSQLGPNLDPQGTEPADTRPRLEPIPSNESTGASFSAPLEDYRKPQTKPARDMYVDPIPDPESAPPVRPADVMPPYVNPDDRTAERLIPQRWAATKIAWSAHATSVQPATHIEPPPRPAPQKKPRWDDTGWRSVNP